MTRTSELDTRAVELADLERRLRLLEERLQAPAPPQPAPAAPVLPGSELAGSELAGLAPMLPVPMLPARPGDWPATSASEWELLAVARVAMAETAMADSSVQVQLHLAADAGTTGTARVLVDGRAAGEEVAIAGTRPMTHTVTVTEGSVIAVQARRSSGDGKVQVAAVLHVR
jgi:hypothetical protein